MIAALAAAALPGGAALRRDPASVSGTTIAGRRSTGPRVPAVVTTPAAAVASAGRATLDVGLPARPGVRTAPVTGGRATDRATRTGLGPTPAGLVPAGAPMVDRQNGRAASTRTGVPKPSAVRVGTGAAIDRALVTAVARGVVVPAHVRTVLAGVTTGARSPGPATTPARRGRAADPVVRARRRTATTTIGDEVLGRHALHARRRGGVTTTIAVGGVLPGRRGTVCAAATARHPVRAPIARRARHRTGSRSARPVGPTSSGPPRRRHRSGRIALIAPLLPGTERPAAPACAERPSRSPRSSAERSAVAASGSTRAR